MLDQLKLRIDMDSNVFCPVKDLALPVCIHSVIYCLFFGGSSLLFLEDSLIPALYLSFV